MEEQETNTDRLDRIAAEMEQLNETLNYRATRPLIRLDKTVVATLLVVADLAFKVIVIMKLWP